MHLRNAFTKLVVVSSLAAFSCFAQSGGGGSLSGQIVDSAGAAVPNAAVMIRQDLTGREQKTVSSEAGLYAFPSLDVGEYTVTVEMREIGRAHV